MPDVLRALAGSASEAGLFCDFDGCLAPIVPEPDDARAVRGAVAALERCARRFRVVAVVSGRSADDLRGRVKAQGVRLIGLHGMEEIQDGRVVATPGSDDWRASVEAVAARLERELAAARGWVLERKGLALAVHFRRAEDPQAAERVASPIVHEAASAGGLEVVPGRRILEVRPMGSGDKGDVVRRLIASESLRAGLVAGDDVGDVPAFRALDGLTVAARVAVASPEAPAELIAGADVVVSSPTEFVALLNGLA